MLDKHGQGNSPHCGFQKFSQSLSNQEKICLGCPEGEYYPLFQCWQSLPPAERDEVFLPI